MQESYTLQRITKTSGSVLRKQFSKLSGKFVRRSIDVNEVTDDIVNLAQLPAYSPNIGILQMRGSASELIVFTEFIYTNDVVLKEFEGFLRNNAVPVTAKGFDTVPRNYMHFFDTPYAGVTADFKRYKPIIRHPDGTKEIFPPIDQFVGVDAETPCVLQIVDPGVMHNKLKHLEMAGNFYAYLRNVSKKTLEDMEVLGFEHRKGTEHKTIEHLVFNNLRVRT